MLNNQILIDHETHVVLTELCDLLHLVGSAKAVEVVQEGDAGTQGRRLSDQGKVHDLLDIVGTKHGPAGLTAGHDVGVVPEDGEALSRDGASGNMEDGRSELPGDLVHVRNHQQQTLGSGKGGGQRTGLQGAVNGTGRSPLGLHLDHLGDGSPDVLLSGGTFGVRDLAHAGRGGDGVDGDHFVGRVGDMGGSRTAIKTCGFPVHDHSPEMQNRGWKVTAFA